jgi:pyruvoyl-dependent arginine decarboxylase
MVPKKIFFTKGVGKHKERLTSFELALRDAGIASQNLVRVSSIFPPQCKVITRKEGLTYLDHGEVVFSVIAENSTREPHRLIVSSIGVAIPADRNTYGYLSEHHSFGEPRNRPANMQKNWLPRCWLRRWMWSSIPTPAGMRRRKSTASQTRLSAPATLRNLQWATNAASGQRRLPRRY